MVRNKKNRGRHNSAHKTKKAGSQTASSKDLILHEDPDDSDAQASPPEPQITGKRQLGFPDRVYLLASIIFQNHHLEKPAAYQLVNYGKNRGVPLPEVKDKEMQHTAYELAFNTLKYQEVVEDIMTDSSLYRAQPIPQDQMSLVAVVLFDFQDRKFLPRQRRGKEEIIQEVREVENYLLRFRIKLAASLARYRIKHDLITIDSILPESVKKKQERSISLPLYAWINTLKSSLDEVQSVLRNAGFSQVKSIGQLDGQTFCQDPHCVDTLVFPAQLKAQLCSTKLLSDHKLIIQDKSCSLGPNAACSLLADVGDVLMAGSFSGLTVSHVASLIAQKHKANNNNQPSVYVCVSDHTDAQREELQRTVSTIGCKNVKLIQEVFQSLDSSDKRLQKVRVILLIPRCSVSAVSNPVEFILHENGDTGLLQDLSRGSIAQSKLESLVAQQRKDIDHALKFPMVLAVVYSTCSSYPEENVDVVNRALQQTKACSDKEGEPTRATFRPSPSPFSSADHGEVTEETEPFFVVEASEHSNGCFLAVLNRKPEPVIQEAPDEVIARANAKGILDRIGLNRLTRKEHHGHTNRMTKPAHAHSSQPLLSVSSQQGKPHQTRGSDCAIPCGRQDFKDLKQSSQGKPRALPLQALKSTWSSSLSYSKECSSASSSSKTEKGTPAQRITPVFSTTTSTTTPLHPACPPSSPLAPVVRFRRPQKEVLKPVLLVLPSVTFPVSFPPQRSGTGFSPSLSFNRWKIPAQTVSHGQFKDGMDKYRPLF
ncbi:putative methyltransferase NSUN7 [Odontesthes bonariensis]|uniref:putative methyltransferase NSUN7 n=1 Tax=Odontesthes bonariensis TaxID=219752 RepID=UPI003F587B59